MADAIIQLYENKLNTTINFGCGEEVTIKKIIENIIEISGKDIIVNWDSTKPNGDIRRQMDITKQIKYNILPKMGIKEGIKKTYKFYEKNR